MMLQSTMREKLIATLVLVAVVVGCSACKDSSSMNFNYCVKFTVAEESDIETIETRLLVMGFEVIEREKDGSTITYELSNSYLINNECFSIITSNRTAYLADEEGNCILSKTDVSKISYTKVNMSVDTNAEFCKAFCENYIGEKIYIITDSAQYSIEAFSKDKTLTFLYGPDEGDEVFDERDQALLSCALNLSTKFLNGNVDVDVEKSGTLVKAF